MTRKLYDLDSHRRDFSATVLRCDPDGARYAVVLDQTVFFPEGGGQGADTGVLGGAHVLDVQLLPDAIVHYTDVPLTPGAQVRGGIDWPQRFRRMQGHSGEHIISGLIHSEYGFDNVGFHLGEDAITMDYSGELTWTQLMHIEQLANEAVYRNVPIRAEYPAPEQLAHMEYRSKLDLKEDIRIVTVEGYDVCACCAPHVSHTGEIGAIKFTSLMRHRGGVRVTILCGSDAEADYREKSAQVAALSAQLSVRQADVVPAVQRLLDEIALRPRSWSAASTRSGCSCCGRRPAVSASSTALTIRSPCANSSMPACCLPAASAPPLPAAMRTATAISSAAARSICARRQRPSMPPSPAAAAASRP